MAKARTSEQFEDKLSEDLVWRKRELSAIKQLIGRPNSATKGQNALLRSGIALLYAHWEGFVKQSSQIYLDFVCSQRLTYEELSFNFVAIAMKAKLNDATSTNKASVYNDVAQFLISKLGERISISTSGVIRTGSNLSFGVLEEVLTCLGIDSTPYQTKSQLIDQRLLGTRNRVAHGDYEIVTCDEYLELHDDVIGMMDEYRDQLSNAVAMELYKRHGGVS